MLSDLDGPAFTLITEALDRRRRRGIAAPTIVSCDNIENNGEIAGRAVLANAESRDPGLAQWIAENTRFPSSMVDRITPATTLQMAAEVRRDFGVNDRWPVVAEPFTAWVLEDDFADGRPPLEQAGVLLVVQAQLDRPRRPRAQGVLGDVAILQHGPGAAEHLMELLLLGEAERSAQGAVVLGERDRYPERHFLEPHAHLVHAPSLGE